MDPEIKDILKRARLQHNHACECCQEKVTLAEEIERIYEGRPLPKDQGFVGATPGNCGRMCLHPGAVDGRYQCCWCGEQSPPEKFFAENREPHGKVDVPEHGPHILYGRRSQF